MDEREQMRRNRQASLIRLRPGAIAATIATIILAIAHFIVGGLPVWLWLLILGLAWMQFLGDMLNVVLLNRQLSRLENR